MSPAELARPFVPLRLLALVGDDDRACIPGAVLAADLTDFTGLTEALSSLAGTEAGDTGGAASCIRRWRRRSTL